jgi:hypothetical protein
MNATAVPSDEWVAGGSKVPDLDKYGVTEGQIALCAVEAIFYAMDKAGSNRQMFVYELAGEFSVALQELMDVDLGD